MASDCLECILGCGIVKVMNYFCLSFGYGCKSAHCRHKAAGIWNVDTLSASRFPREAKTASGGILIQRMRKRSSVLPSTTSKNRCYQVVPSQIIKRLRRKKLYFVFRLLSGVGIWRAEASDDTERNALAYIGFEASQLILFLSLFRDSFSGYLLILLYYFYKK